MNIILFICFINTSYNILTSDVANRKYFRDMYRIAPGPPYYYKRK